MPTLPADATRSFSAAGPTASYRPVDTASDPVRLAFDNDTRVLLRWRLLVIHIANGIINGTFLILSGLGMNGPNAQTGPSTFQVVFRTFVFAQAVSGALYLRLRPGASLRSLRWLELLHFGLFTAEAGVFKYLSLVVPPRDSPDPDYQELAVVNSSAITSFVFMMLIVAYGVLIPNTRRRSLTVVSGMIGVAFAAVLAAAAVNPLVRPLLPFILVTHAIQMFMPSLIAVFASTRFNALHRQVFEARREAQQIGPYTLKRKLGEGGMGEVFLAEHRLIKRPCAVKFIRPDLAAHPASAARFAREVQAVTGLSHPNTVRVYDYGRADDGSFYYVMEYLDGPTLDGLVKSGGPLPPGRVVYLLRQLCGALAEAHAAGLVHRDLKPGNVIVAGLGGQRDVAKLLDFGLVQDLSSTADDRLTRTGTVVGTPAYMCPEQAGGEPNVDARGDVYSLGAVGYFALTGRPPFAGTTLGQLLTAHLTQPLPTLPHAPEDLARVVLKCLAKNPADRYQSAIELDAGLTGCACAADWSAGRAAAWWADRPNPVAAPADPTKTFA